MACGSCQAMGQNCLFWIAERAVSPAGKGRFGSPNGLSCNSLGNKWLARAGWAAVFNINMLMATRTCWQAHSVWTVCGYSYLILPTVGLIKIFEADLPVWQGT